MGKAGRTINKLLRRRGSLTSGNIEAESSIQPPTSVNTEFRSQNPGEEVTIAPDSSKAKELKAYEERESAASLE